LRLCAHRSRLTSTPRISYTRKKILRLKKGLEHGSIDCELSAGAAAATLGNPSSGCRIFVRLWRRCGRRGQTATFRTEWEWTSSARALRCDVRVSDGVPGLGIHPLPYRPKADFPRNDLYSYSSSLTPPNPSACCPFSISAARPRPRTRSGCAFDCPVREGIYPSSARMSGCGEEEEGRGSPKGGVGSTISAGAPSASSSQERVEARSDGLTLMGRGATQWRGILPGLPCGVISLFWWRLCAGRGWEIRVHVVLFKWAPWRCLCSSFGWSALWDCP